MSTTCGAQPGLAALGALPRSSFLASSFRYSRSRKTQSATYDSLVAVWCWSRMWFPRRSRPARDQYMGPAQFERKTRRETRGME